MITASYLATLEWHALVETLRRAPNSDLRAALGRSENLDRSIRRELARRDGRDVWRPGLPLLVRSAEQLVVDGSAEPVNPPAPSGKHETQRLFTAPQTIRGQMTL